MKKFLLGLILSLSVTCPLFGHAQATDGFHRTAVALARSFQGVTAQVVPNAKITVTDTATGLAADIYSDPLLSSQIIPAVVTADNSGNYGYYIHLNYCVTETITSPGQGTQVITNICNNSSGGGGGCNPTGTSGYFLQYTTDVPCLPGYIDEGVTTADTLTSTDKKIALHAEGGDNSTVHITATGEDGVDICTAVGGGPNCPADGDSGTISITGGSGIDLLTTSGAINAEANDAVNIQSDTDAINLNSVATTQLSSTGGIQLFDSSDVSHGIELLEQSSDGNIVVNNAGTGDIEFNSAGGLQLNDASSAGLFINENGTGPLNIEGSQVGLFSDSAADLQGNGSQICTMATGCGGGSGTVNSGTTSQLAYYASTGTAVSGASGVTTTGTEIAVSPAANATPLTISNYSLTGSSASPIASWSGTWNTTGTPTMFVLNVTDTASNASSLLASFGVNGTPEFPFFKNGRLGFASSTQGIGPLSGGLAIGTFSNPPVSVGGGSGINQGLRIGSSFGLSWSSTGGPGNGNDTGITRVNQGVLMVASYNTSGSSGTLATVGGSVVTNPCTVATLPSGVDGARAFVTDSTLPYAAANLGVAVVGGGTYHVPVYYDGSSSTWKIGG